MRKLPVACPSCEKSLSVSELSCASCGTKITGNFSLPSLLQLPVDEQEFLFQFIRSSGSLKKMASQMQKSYPTVRNKLDDILEKIEHLEKQSETI
ncbi:MAG TPA: DUF2089 family protein [Flavobacteriaceae bacterium]|nr:DUF2089 family protein [Flavobacteriaceae bacterium]